MLKEVVRGEAVKSIGLVDRGDEEWRGGGQGMAMLMMMKVIIVLAM